MEQNDKLLDQFTRDFFNGNINFSLKKEDLKRMDWEWQNELLNRTLNKNLLIKYPVSAEYTRLYLKQLLSLLESGQNDVHDDIYTHLCRVLNEANKNGFSYRHYVVGGDLNNVITIKETRNMVVNGTTGLKTWEAALILSDWALNNQDIFSKKNVWELGSGVGFTGITISKNCDVKSLIFTDCHTDVLKTICENIPINMPDLKREEMEEITFFKNAQKSLGVMMLDWTNFDDLPYTMVPDIVIGADIVYDPSILQPLCNVIKTLCNRNKDLEVYIASVVRKKETFSEFMKTLCENALKFEKIELLRCTFEWDESIDKCLLKITAVSSKEENED